MSTWDERLILGIIADIRDLEGLLLSENGNDFSIVLPDDRTVIKALTEKFQEYTERLRDQEDKDPELRAAYDLDSTHKIAVLEKLLAEGRVDGHELAKQLFVQLGDGFSPPHFRRACAVIGDYIATGGANTTGGTGFGSNRKPTTAHEQRDLA